MLKKVPSKIGKSILKENKLKKETWMMVLRANPTSIGRKEGRRKMMMKVLIPTKDNSLRTSKKLRKKPMKISKTKV